MGKLFPLLLIVLLPVLISGQPASPPDWKTLSGRPPLVIANGGSSGLFPDQTGPAYSTALRSSVDGTLLLCDLQLTKDFKGICRTGLDLTASTVLNLDPGRLDFNLTTYEVNGQAVRGVFSVDLTFKQINETGPARQANYGRTPAFDGYFRVVTPSDVLEIISLFSQETNKSGGLWLNVEYVKFYEDHGLNMTDFIQTAVRATLLPDYVSCTEVALLRRISSILRGSKSTSKLVFKIPSLDAVEPSTGRRYSSFTADEIKNFSSGVLVPTSAIWYVNPATNYTNASTTLVQDYHQKNLTVFAGSFVSDAFKSFNYSYDPIREYLAFISNGEFSLDGILTEFPTTASEALSCYASSESVLQTGPTPLNPQAIKRTIISHNGASGDYPGCTIRSYEAAIRDGADYIDCPVQFTSDGAAICLESPNLFTSTNAAMYQSLRERLSKFQGESGVFTFNVTWSQIEQLKAFQSRGINQCGEKCRYAYTRDEAYNGVEGLLLLSDFLKFARNHSGTGVYIDFQNAYFLATEAGLDVVNTVVSVLKEAGYDGRPNATHPVLIQSEDSSVLEKLQEVLPEYPRVYRFKVDSDDPLLAENVSIQALQEITKFASALSVPKSQMLLPLVDAQNLAFLTGNRSIVNDAHGQNLTVYVGVQRNEPTSFAFEFESDPTRELYTLTEYYNVDGFISDYPATVAAYLRQGCYGPVGGLKSSLNNFTIPLVEPGALYDFYLQFNPDAPPSEPVPDAIVDQPPLPSGPPNSTNMPPAAGVAPPPSPSSGTLLQAPSLFVMCLIGAALVL